MDLQSLKDASDGYKKHKKMKTKQKINQIKDLYKQKLRILLQKMNDNTNPRATKIVTSQEQDSTDQIIQELQNNQHLNTFFVLSKFIDCNQIKNQPQFIQILFNDHLQIVIELIEWMLIPNFIIKKKKIKTNVDSYPFQCRQFLKDNWCFYQQMYIAARNKTIDFGRIFNFLRKDYFDKNTIYTALGYFADVFIPFAKYEFCGSFNLSKSLEIQHTSKNVQTLSIMKILPQNLIDQLITYCHYEPVFQFLKTAILVSIQDQRDYQISRLAALKWMKAAKIQNIFSKFPAKNQIVNDQISQSMECLQNISSMLKEMIQNLQPSSVEFSFRNFVLIDIILKSDIIKYSVESLTKTRLCGIPNKINQKLHSSASLNSNVQATSNIILSSSAHITSTIPQNNSLMTGSPSIITDIDQEDIVQILFKILSSIVQIFVRIPRTLNISDQVDEKDLRNVFPTSNQHKSQEYIQIQVKSPTTKPISATSHDSKHFDNKESASKNYKSKLRLITYCEYLAMTSQFHDQMQYLLNNLETISKIVYNQTQNGLGTSISKIIPFSSGQNVKAISFMKLEYFNLLHNCLIMIQIKDVDSNSSSATPLTQKDKQKITLRKMKSITLLPFQLKIQRLHSLQIIKKYLNQNRWNNLAHHTLQKICHLLIICSFGYIKKNIEKDKNNRFSDSFLAYLIQNFTRRDFVFLNTVKFTTQGNLHSLYNIAKDLAYTLNSTNELVIFLNELEPWKKFIMTDLKNYQQKTFPSAIKPQVQEKQENQSYKLKVDEVDTIKKLIQNIPKRLKWPTKTKNKNMSKSGLQRFGKVLDDSVKLEPSQQHMTISGSKISKPYKKSQKNQLIVGLEDILRRKIQLTKKGSEVRQFQIEDISVIKNINVQQKKHKSQIFQSTKSIEQTDDK